MMNVFQLVDAVIEYNCSELRNSAAGRLFGAPGMDGLMLLYAADTGINDIPDRDWIQTQRGKLYESGVAIAAIGPMELPEFEAAIRKLRRADKADKKTDNGKNLPPKEVVECARYIRRHWELVEQRKASKKFKKTLISEAVGESNRVAMERQLRRYPDLLILPDRPDK